MHAPRQLAAVGDDHRLGGLAALAAHALHGAHDLHALDHLAEDNVLAVQPGCAAGGGSARARVAAAARAGRRTRLHGAQEELGAVGARASVGHGKDALASVLELEVLILRSGWASVRPGYPAMHNTLGVTAARTHRELGAVDGLAT